MKGARYGTPRGCPIRHPLRVRNTVPTLGCPRPHPLRVRTLGHPLKNLWLGTCLSARLVPLTRLTRRSGCSVGAVAQIGSLDTTRRYAREESR